MTIKEKADELFAKMCSARREYINFVRESLIKIGTELPLDNGYGEPEPLIINVVDDNGTGVDTYELDKARCNGEFIQFHVVAYNGDECDMWIDGCFLGSDEDYAIENIIFGDGDE